jgi:hypothetical protein
MIKDQAWGALILISSLAGLVVYSWLLYAYPTLILQATAFVAVALICVILAWIGWTMATTPPPAPLEIPAPKEPPPESP